MEKLAEREKKARDETEKIKLARKKKSSTANMDDEFDIDVSNEPAKKSPKKNLKSNKRINKDSKFGFGGQKRNRKSNTAESTADLGGFNVKKMKGNPRIKKGSKVNKRK